MAAEGVSAVSEIPAWLPALIGLHDYGGDWPRYLEAIYAIFRRDLVEHRPSFEGQRVGIKRLPIDQGKEAGFWHLISEGKIEAGRLPDLRRCERIGWPKPMIETSPSDKIKVWKNTRRGEPRVVIALPDFSYVVVLAVRTGYVLLWTAYCVEEDHRRKKLRREYEAFAGV
jgi:hypothetical protein